MGLLQVSLAGYLGPKTVQATLLDKMPESMRKEIEKIISDAGGERLQPTRFTRKEQALRASQSGPVGATISGQGDKGSAALPKGDQLAVCHDTGFNFKSSISLMVDWPPGIEL